MKRLWICMALLAAMAAMGLWTGMLTDSLCSEATALLEQGEAAALAGDLPQAERLTVKAHDLWQARLPLFHAFLRHDALDGITSGLEEALALLRTGEQGEYTAACRRVRAELEMLRDSEHLTLENVL